MHQQTPSQTIGPFFHPCLLRTPQHQLPGCDPRDVVRIEGRVLDANGEGVTDAMVEVWQANQHGRYPHPADQRELPLDDDFTGFGRSGTDAHGRFWFETVKPGPVPHRTGTQAPHLNLVVFARGLLNHLHTRCYFADEPANDTDAVLCAVPPDRRRTLIARTEHQGDQTVHHLDIVLQGEHETVFFDV